MLSQPVWLYQGDHGCPSCWMFKTVLKRPHKSATVSIIPAALNGVVLFILLYLLFSVVIVYVLCNLLYERNYSFFFSFMKRTFSPIFQALDPSDNGIVCSWNSLGMFSETCSHRSTVHYLVNFLYTYRWSLVGALISHQLPGQGKVCLLQLQVKRSSGMWILEISIFCK